MTEPAAREPETETETGKRKHQSAWHPGLFLGLMIGAVLFWPLGAAGLIAQTSVSAGRRLQGLIVIWAGVVGYFWGWKFLWPLFD